MKKLLCMLLMACLLLSCFGMVSLAEDRTLSVDEFDRSLTKGVSVAGGKTTYWEPSDSYIGFKGLDFTGVRSIRITAEQRKLLSANGEAPKLYLDNPLTGVCIGYINVPMETDGPTEFGVNIKPTTGVHDLYICQNYNETGTYFTLHDVTLSQEEWVRQNAVSPVPDSAIVDNFHDTWTAVSQNGVKLADFEETGPVKSGTHKVCMFYWDWHQGGRTPVIISEAIKQYPESKYDYYHPVWQNKSCYWDEPVYGYYTSLDYWVYRKQAELLADAGVDAVFFDYTNYQNCYVTAMTMVLQAFHDARAAGCNVPKVSAYLQMGWSADLRLNSLKAMYNNYFSLDDYKDLWFIVDGKPMVIQLDPQTLTSAPRSGDTSELELAKFFLDFFTFRSHGSRSAGPASPEEKSWLWLENYPQYEWGIANDGVRVECVGLGMAINESYVFGSAGTGDFSDPYSKGKSYTEAFGDDYREGAYHQGYFFREQASRVLDIDPAYVFVDGWNEWNTARNENRNNSFVDLYDSEGSRDFEPTRGELKDEYYLLLTDFIRKYKGVRPAPLASEEKTIDLQGALAQWDDVLPLYINDDCSYERDAEGFLQEDGRTPIHYTTEVKNAISTSKVARDADNFYFMAQCQEDVVTGFDGCMVLYVNTDRNYATGWEGYDVAINLDGMGVVSRFTGTGWERETVGRAAYAAAGKAFTLSVPRALLGVTEPVAIEFKWTDNILPEGDLINFYSEGVSAPIGRFNYLYTTVEQTALTNAERSRLSNTTVLKAGAKKMIIKGGKMNVYDADTRVTAFMQDGTLYVPMEAMEEFMGYGMTKIVYDYTVDMMIVKTHDLDDREIVNFQWIYTTPYSYEAHMDGVPVALSHPVIAANGLWYLPISLLSDCFGWDVVDLGDGAFAVSKTKADAETAKTVLSHLS